MTRDEIIDYVDILCYRSRDEGEQDRIVALLRDTLPHSGIVDLIFQDMRNLSPEQIVDEAYRCEEEHALKTRSQKPPFPRAAA